MYIRSNIMLLLFLATSLGIKDDSYLNNRDNIFQTFLRKYLNLLVDGCSGKLLKNHCRIMYLELDKIGYRHTKDLGKIFKDLSKMYTDFIHSEIKGYLKELDRTTNRRDEFFKALNEAYHARESILFENYVNDLSDYCNGQKLFIKEETHKLLREAILPGVEKLSNRKQRALRKKLKSALKEYSKLDLIENMNQYGLPTLPSLTGLSSSSESDSESE